MGTLIILVTQSACTSPSPRSEPVPNSISGHVYNERDNAPIRNALVQIEWKGPIYTKTPGKTITPLPTNPSIKLPKTDTRTESDGYFIIGNLPSGKYQLTVTADDLHNSPRVTVEVIDTAPTIKDITLYEYSSISGHVYRSEDGKPLAGARIEVWPATLVPYMATTDTQGKYIVTKLPHIEAQVTVGASGYVPKFNGGTSGSYTRDQKIPLQYGVETKNIDFILEKGGSITGQVFDTDGVSFASDAIVLYVQTGGISTPGLFKGDTPQPYPPRVLTDANGKYSIVERLTGMYEVTAMKGGSTSPTIQVSVTIGRESITNFVLSPGGSISGHVYRSDGVTPISGAAVGAHPSFRGSGDYSTITKADGSYSFPSLPSGDCNLTTSIPGPNTRAKVTVVAGQNIVCDLIIPK